MLREHTPGAPDVKSVSRCRLRGCFVHQRLSGAIVLDNNKYLYSHFRKRGGPRAGRWSPSAVNYLYDSGRKQVRPAIIVAVVIGVLAFAFRQARRNIQTIRNQRRRSVPSRRTIPSSPRTQAWRYYYWNNLSGLFEYGSQKVVEQKVDPYRMKKFYGKADLWLINAGIGTSPPASPTLATHRGAVGRGTSDPLARYMRSSPGSRSAVMSSRRTWRFVNSRDAEIAGDGNRMMALR